MRGSLLRQNMTDLLFLLQFQGPGCVRPLQAPTVKHCGWEGNRKSGIALVMRGLSTYRLNGGLHKGHEHPPVHCGGARHPLTVM